MGASQVSSKRLFEEARTGLDRYVDMRIAWVMQDLRGQIPELARPIVDVGGRWDRLAKCWAGPGETARIFGFHEGQRTAAEWSVEWLKAKARGAAVLENGLPIYSALLEGGRRAGKTDLGVKLVCTYCVMRPGSIGWLVSETEKKAGETEEYVKRFLHPDWYRYLGAPAYCFLLANGSVIELRSAHDPDKLKEGTVDIAALNEAQLIAERAFINIRGNIVDSGGLAVAMANPPDRPIGFWVERFHEEAMARRRQARVFFFDNEKNPHVDRQALELMRSEMDERTYLREVRGMFLPRADVVFHAWSDSPEGNIAPLPIAAREVTAEFLRRRLRRDVDACLAIDLQRNPYPCAVGVRFFADPKDPKGDPLTWFCDAIVVEGGDEEGLALALLEEGYDPKRTALILDASGSWQGIDRKKKVPSFDIFKRLGWIHLFKPDERIEKNPPVMERIKGANALFKNARGERRVFSDPDLLELNQAIKLWENRNGTPYKRSDYAHLCDAATYALWRFFPRALKPRGSSGTKVRGGTYPAARPGSDFRY